MTRGMSGSIVFCAAAGPRIGFGHLVRCRSLARALGVEPLMTLRGRPWVRARAMALGATVVEVSSAAGLRALGPSLVVIDDPSPAHATRWLHRARRAGVPVASVHDLGLGYVASDLLIDGSVCPGTAPSGADQLAGPAYAVLDPAVAQARQVRRRRSPRVLLALGGGHHVIAAAARVASALAHRIPHVDLRVARGFSASGTLPSLAVGRWIDAPAGLARELAEARVAVVAGGITLYEACALGTPVVGVAVTTAQQRTVRALAGRAAAIDGGRHPLDTAAAAGVANAVAHLLDDGRAAAAQARQARRIVDGRGARRVAARLRGLACLATGRSVRRVA